MNEKYRGLFSKMGEGLLQKYLQDALEELSQKPDDQDVLFKVGVAYARLRKIDKAREIYKKLKAIDSKRASELLDVIYDA